MSAARGERAPLGCCGGDAADDGPPGRVRDPVCGMWLDPSAARGATVEHGGRTHHFCGERCRSRALAEPARFLDRA